jgi:hypothetical protein
MPLLIRCPDCEADNRVGEDMKGKDASCTVCGASFKVGKEAKFVELTAEEKRKAEEEEAKARKRKSRRTDLDDEDDDDRPSNRRRRDDDDDDDRERRRGRPRGQSSGAMSDGQKVAAGVVGGIVVLSIVSVGIWAATAKKTNSTGGSNSPGPVPPTDRAKGNGGGTPGAPGVPGKKESEFDSNLRALRTEPNRFSVIWFSGQPVNPARKVEVARALDNALRAPDMWVGYDASEALKKWGDKESVQPLVDFYYAHNDGILRPRVVEALGEIKDPASAKALAGFLKAKGGDTQKILESLRKIGKPGENEVASLLNDDDTAIQIEACKVLAQIGTKDSLPALEQVVEKNRPGLKMKGSRLFTEANRAVNSIKARGA